MGDPVSASLLSNPAVIGGALNLAGGIFGGSSASDAAQISANAQLEASRMAAEAGRFQPVGLAGTRFGIKPIYTLDPSGRLTGVEGGLTPEMQAYQDRLLSLTGRGLSEAELAQSRLDPLLGGAQRLFTLGETYLGQSPEEVANRYMLQQQNILAPTRERQLAELRNRGFQTGREGLSVGATGLRPGGGMGLGASNPEMEAYFNAIAQQDAQLAGQAEEEARKNIAFGGSLYNAAPGLLGGRLSGLSSAYAPFSTGLGVASSLDELAYEPIRRGAELGGRVMQGGAQAGQSLLYGGLGAARTMQPANALNPFARTISNLGESREFTSGLGNLFSPFGATPQGAYAQQGQYLSGALTNPQTQQARMLSEQNAGFYGSPEGYSSFLY